MAWIYLAESQDSRLPWAPGSILLHIVRTTDTRKPYYCQECKRGVSHSHPFGMTCGHWRPTVSTDELKSTSYQRASRARTSVLQELERAWAESEVDFSSNCIAWSKRFHPHSYSLKTSQPLGLEEWRYSLKSLPILGMTVDGRVSLPQSLVPRTSGKGGSYLPTPSAQTYGSNRGGGAGRVGEIRHSLDSLGIKNPRYREWMMGFPIGWTEIKDWATQWYRSRPEKHLND